MKTATIINTYMIRQFLLAFVCVQTVIMGIILMFDTIELIRRTANKNLFFSDVIQMAFLKLPQMINITLPFSIMIAAILVFWKLTRSQELIVMRASGISVWGFISPIIIVTLLVGIINLLILNPVAAAMYKKYEKIQEKNMLKTSNPLLLNEKGLWLRDYKDDGTQIVFNAKNVKLENSTLIMQDISITELDKDNVFSKGIEAKSSILQNNSFILTDVWVIELEKAGVSMPNMTYPTNLTLDKIQENFASVQTLSFWELPKFIKFYKASGFSPDKHLIHLYSLYASPLLLCAFVLIAAVFSLSPNIRSGKITFRIIIALASGFTVFVFSKITYALGLSGTLPLSLAAFAPAIITILLSVTAILHLEDG